MSTKRKTKSAPRRSQSTARRIVSGIGQYLDGAWGDVSDDLAGTGHSAVSTVYRFANGLPVNLDTIAEDFEDGRQAQRRDAKRFVKENPRTAGALSTAGLVSGLAGAGAAAKGAVRGVNALRSGALTTGQVARSAAKVSPASVVSGALFGAANGETSSERLANAGIGAGIGALAAPVVALASKAPRVAPKPRERNIRELTPEETDAVAGGASGYGANDYGVGYSPEYSKLKNQPKYGDLDLQITPGDQMSPVKPLKPEDLQGALIVSAPADRSRAGGVLSSINGEKLNKPVQLQGGMDFMRVQEALGHNSGEKSVWASAPGVISGFGRVAREAAEKGQKAYLAPWAMAGASSDYSHMPASVVVQQLLKSDPKSVRMFEKEILSKFPAYVGSKDPKALITQVESDPALRYNMMKLLDTKKMQDAGLPSANNARLATTEPALLDVPSGTFGYNIGLIDPSGVTIKDPMLPHSTYAAQLKGNYAGSLEAPVGATTFLRDATRAMEANPKGFIPAHIEYNLKRGVKTQEADQQWVDEVSAEIERLRSLGLGFSR
jgi:hypothetical protein